MTKLRSLPVAFVVALFAFASASLLAQAPARPMPNDAVTLASSQNVPPLSTSQDQSEPSDAARSALPMLQSQDNSEQAPVSQTGIIVGTVTDMNEAPVPGATVDLEGRDPGDVRSVTTNESGFFEIRDAEPGRPYKVRIRAAGFAEWESPEVILDPGQSKILDVSKLRIEEVETAVTVTPESFEEVATEQVKAEEKQRGFGIIPNFYAVYDSNSAPLTAKLRFRLALRVARDPFTLAGVAFLAGLGQAADNPNYVQGAKGYGERLGASYANSFTDLMLNGAILPSLLHQDPRYFYQGRGSTGSRVGHALYSLVVTKGDNGRLQPNYSSIGGDLASAALANLYYPKSDRGAGLVLEGFAVNTAIHAAVRLLDEFVFRPARTTRARNNASNDSPESVGNRSAPIDQTAASPTPRMGT